MTIIIYIIIAIIGVVLLLTIIAPKNYHVSRHITIDKPLPEVFDYLKYVKNQSRWSPWEAKDPEMQKDFVGTDGMVGFVSKWKGNKEVGEGEQEITNIVKNKVVETQLRFLKPWKSVSDAYIKVSEVTENITKVTWGFQGENKFPMSIFMLFMNMDKTVGKDFEEGLGKLKRVLEKQ
ncbi:SRPBCC family protein [Zhouia spongiae]|uniref:SRPBCC family protein n=1 Tax=Zhouia spongiae TaxID=2202721 RepID=A0ABY3YIJ9_9FLAO|nr:SRPBCC family protein [Zhouia spongiae]UNY97692.1 SRPBCC family protein [Zhouia spongiae]